jgi:prepilin-type N-terminal cleavage/methylation domain-containing protein
MDAELGRNQAGFTLIELLVATAVLAVLAVGASLAATRGDSGISDAQRFEQSYASARAFAVQGQARLGLRITPRSSQPARHTQDGWEDTGRETRWRGRVAFAATGAALSGALSAAAPQIVFLPNGRTNAFSIVFGGGAAVTCRSDGWTGLICEGG